MGSNALSCVFNSLLGDLAVDVLAVGVAEVLGEVGQHGLEHFRMDRSGGSGVEVFGELDVGQH